MDTPIGCGMMGFAETSGPLCAGLERLKEENVPFWKEMGALEASARSIGSDARGENGEEALRALEERVRSFVEALDLHSRREEEVLFPLMAQYIGRETGPIAVMEYEHEQAKRRLGGFLARMEEIDGSIEADVARPTAGEVAEAVQILSDHFRKEENVLFPMAERILSDEEKEQLLEGIRAI